MNLFIPLEIKTRELESKLLVAFEAVYNNFNVIIGPKDKIIDKLLNSKQGIVLWSFGNVKNYEKLFEYINNLGHKIATIDEEGLVFLNKEIYSKYRISIETIKNVELCFAWGNVHKEAMLYRTPEIEDKIVIIGNPRFDLLRPEFREIMKDDAIAIKKKHSSFILINTNFPFYNHYFGKDYFYSFLKKVFMIRDSIDDELWRSWINYQGKIFKEFLEIIPKLSKAFTNYKIIVRPHPSENHEVWRDSVKGLTNVFINSEGNVVSWIMASEAMVHNGCTTAVEAFVLDIPVIAYRPFSYDLFDNILPNQLSYNVFDFEGLNSKLHEILLNDKREIFKDDSKIQILNQYILFNSGDLAKDKIARALAEVRIKDVNIVNKYLIYRNYYKIRKFVGKYLRLIFRKEKAGKGYLKHKFPELTSDEIRSFLIKIQKVTGKYSNITIKNIGNSCFEITSCN